jgi:hypothetical protein
MCIPYHDTFIYYSIEQTPSLFKNLNSLLYDVLLSKVKPRNVIIHLGVMPLASTHCQTKVPFMEYLNHVTKESVMVEEFKSTVHGKAQYPRQENLQKSVKNIKRSPI